MNAIQDRYWPFDVVPPERRTEQHQREIQFLETAYQAGYRPYVFGSQNFGATAGERAGEILYRGSRGKHWEVSLMNSKKPILSAHVDDFNSATEALLRWLVGVEQPEIVEHIRDRLYSTTATPSGFTLHCQE